MTALQVLLQKRAARLRWMNSLLLRRSYRHRVISADFFDVNLTEEREKSHESIPFC